MSNSNRNSNGVEERLTSLAHSLHILGRYGTDPALLAHLILATTALIPLKVMECGEQVQSEAVLLIEPKQKEGLCQTTLTLQHIHPTVTTDELSNSYFPCETSQYQKPLIISLSIVANKQANSISTRISKDTKQ
jgi:hypothetical protein